MLTGKKEKEVKTHIPEPDFNEFIANLSNDGLSRSEWMRIQIHQYNIRKREQKKYFNVFNIFTKE